MVDLPRNWATVKIGDIGKVITGKTPPTKRKEYYGNRYPFITPTDISDASIYVETERYLSEDGYLLQRKALLPPKTICFTCIASIGKICITSQPSFTNQQINSICVNNGNFDYRFIYYLLISETDRIRKFASGAATPIISKGSFSQIELTVPSLPIQQKIAAILSAYDDLIENNTRRIRILEEMAQMIYREWFVNFRFPGHEGVGMVDSPLGLIPEGWEVLHVGDAFETLGGGTPSTKIPEYWDNGNILWYSPSDLTASKSMFVFDSEKKITELGLKKSAAKFFPAYSVMMTSRATIGVVAVNSKPACTNQGFITCIPNEKLSVFQIYYWILENKEKIDSVASGATYKEINRSEFRGFQVVIPDKSISINYNRIVNPIGREIEVLLTKNLNLRAQRDLLLPRLVSGELEVENIDI